MIPKKYDPKAKYDIKKGGLGVVWLGQAGFLFVTSTGKKIMLDPFASDSCQRLIDDSYIRICPFPFGEDELDCDALLVTHHHEDHYDTDYVPELAKKCNMKIFASPSAAALCERDGIDMSTVTKIARGQSFEFDGIKAKGVFADHGKMAPDALGFVLDIDGFTVYITGDTGYAIDQLKQNVAKAPDLLIAPINGAYGNLNEEEAANLTVELGAKNIIPCHYWTFRPHGGNPQKFFDEMEKRGISEKAKFMTPGKIVIF